MSDAPGGRAYLGSSGEAIVDGFGYLSPSGWVRPDGKVVFQDRDERLKISPPKRHAEDAELSLGSARGETQLWVGPSFVVWMDKLGRSYLSPIDEDGVGDRVDLGNVPAWSAVWTCRGKAGPVLALYAPRAEQRSAALFVLYPNGAEYAPAIEYASPFSERSTPTDVPFACSPSGAPRWAWVESQRVRELSCPPSGCVAQVSEPLDAAKVTLGGEGSLVHAAAPVGEDRVVVTRLLRGRRRLFMSQIRALTAKVTDLPSTKDVLVVGDLVPFEAPSWTHPEAFACGDTAWVTARLDGKLYAFRSTDGVRFEPVTLE
jgi:hypothetical protein